jgi:hypothetical protein
MMRKNRLFSLLCLSASIFSSYAVTVEWDKIVNWTGEGTNKAALVVQFLDDGSKEAYVWGFRWNESDYENGAPSGEDMFRAIAGNSRDLLLFTQYTGWMGSTVDGIGYFNPEKEHLANLIEYNFNGAKEDSRISFDYFNPNEIMGQTKAPGNFTPLYCKNALEESKTTNIIEHPINALEYGYPAYDYDWWQPGATLDLNTYRWNAGWYDGYWSYWVGSEDLDKASYSGLGYSSRKLSDGQVDGWKYTQLDGPVSGDVDGYTGASTPWHTLNYNHFDSGTTIKEIITDREEIEGIYSMTGVKEGSRIEELSDGLYVVRFTNGKSRKILISHK